jgi:hypothetical protein
MVRGDELIYMTALCDLIVDCLEEMEEPPVSEAFMAELHELSQRGRSELARLSEARLSCAT